MIQSVDVKVDFLTITTDTCVETSKLGVFADKVAATVLQGRKWRLLRYIGWTAQSPIGEGGMAFGKITNAKGILQLWGMLSNRWLFEAMRGMQAKVTRCDYAVTVLHDKPQPPISEVIRGLKESDAVYTAIVPVSQAGGTLYVGSRASEKFGRIYDKGSQLATGVPPRVYWRYELEYKRSCAQNAVKILMDGDRPRDNVKTILGNVWTYFAQSGINMPSFDADIVGYPLVKYGVVARTFDKTLSWLETQVNPALVRLYREGYGESAARALGIEGTNCVTVRLNTDTQITEDLQDDFFDVLQGQ